MGGAVQVNSRHPDMLGRLLSDYYIYITLQLKVGEHSRRPRCVEMTNDNLG